MSYCSLKEAYGEDFYNQVNNNHYLDPSPYTSSPMNPSRNNMYIPGSRDGSELSRVKNAQHTKMIAQKQSSNDLATHWNSFNSVSGRRYEKPPKIRNDSIIRAWGEVESEKYSPVDELSPKEYLKKSLLHDRPIRSPHQDVSSYEPEGYSRTLTTYKNLNKSPCQDYFYHLDTCKKCQHKLKKRVVRYFKALQRHNRSPNTILLPGSKDMKTNQLLESELFRDDDELDEPSVKIEEEKPKPKEKEKEIVSEGFQNPVNNRAMYLMLFGLFIIYALDQSKR
jgi:hypothetical protein